MAPSSVPVQDKLSKNSCHARDPTQLNSILYCLSQIISSPRNILFSTLASNTNDEMTDFATIREICGKKKNKKKNPTAEGAFFLWTRFFQYLRPFPLQYLPPSPL